MRWGAGARGELPGVALLTPRYREQVKCIYIDPPYNTGDDDFPYKDDFDIRMAGDDGRPYQLVRTLAVDGGTFVSIDDEELSAV